MPSRSSYAFFFPSQVVSPITMSQALKYGHTSASSNPMKDLMRAQRFRGRYSSAFSIPISAPAHRPTEIPSSARIISSGT